MYGTLPVVEAVAIHNPAENTVTVFALNCDQNEAVEFRAELGHFGKPTLKRHIILDGADLSACNTFETPDAVVPREVRIGAEEAESLKTILPKLSWNVLRYSVG